MKLLSLTFRLALLATLFASGCAEPPVPEDPYQEESEANTDEGSREESDDEAPADDDDTGREADDDEADDRSAADDQAAPRSTHDAGSARDAGKPSSEPEPDASANSRTTDDAAAASPAPAAELDFAGLFSDGGLLAPKIPGPPSPDNPVECPPVAPDNPIGPCIGVPVYATCTYGTYVCLCDWVHWLCI